MSNMCNVDLSEVTANSRPDGDIARQKIVAGSMPRRSSVSFALLLVVNTRTNVP